MADFNRFIEYTEADGAARMAIAKIRPTFQHRASYQVLDLHKIKITPVKMQKFKWHDQHNHRSIKLSFEEVMQSADKSQPKRRKRPLSVDYHEYFDRQMKFEEAKQKFIQKNGYQADFSDLKTKEQLIDLTEKLMKYTRYFDKSNEYPWYATEIEQSLFDESCKEFNLRTLITVLDRVPGKMPGIKSSYLFLGMFGTAFAFHREDMFTYSINYHHSGAPKLWVAICLDDNKKFYDLIASRWLSLNFRLIHSL